MTELTEKRNDEIDLIELIKVLWNKKIWILISAFIFTAIAGVYAFTAKEKWTSKAEVIAPRIIDLGDYFNLKKEYALIIDTEFDPNALIKELYSKFELFAYSLDERESFFSQSSIYKKLAEGKSKGEQLEILSDLVLEDISIVKPDIKKDPDAIGTKINFVAQTAEDAQQTLNDFVSYINQKAFSLDLNEFLIWINERIKALTYEKSLIEQNLSIQKTVQVENLIKALDIAKAAGIKEYTSTLTGNNVSIPTIAASDAKIPLSDSKLSDGTYLFMLGEKYLKAQLDTIKNTALIYPPRYYDIQEQLKKLELLLPRIKDAKAQTYTYQASPVYPVKIDWPKRGLLLAVGFVLGGILGGIIVLGQNVFSVRKES